MFAAAVWMRGVAKGVARLPTRVITPSVTAGLLVSALEFLRLYRD